VDNLLASTLCIHSFSAHHTESSIKGISTIHLAITENMECSIIKVRAPLIDLKVGVSHDHSVSLCFVLLLKTLGNIPSKE